MLDNAACLGRALFGEAARARLPMPARVPSGHPAALGFPVDLRERIARLEGLFEGFTRREPTSLPPAA